MKNILTLILSFVIFCSCEDDVKFSNESIQAQKNGAFWEATSYKAVLTSNGYVVFTATTGFETLTIRTSTISPHTSSFGKSVEDFAEYSNTTPNASGNYSTGINGSTGEIVITEYSGGTVSGNFKFNAINVLPGLTNPDSVIFRNGVIYKIPVTIVD